jgi:hypothetical protein
MIEAVTFGPSKVTFQFNGRKAIAHVELVEKNNKKYIIGSSFYL